MSNHEVPLQESEPTYAQLNKQNSILSLTLDEFYCKNGKSLGSMNMDEFLASIWNSDDNQVNPPLLTHDEAAKGKNVATEHTISQPGSFSVPPPICKKTVDEVWSQIHKSQPQHNEANNSLSRNETLKKQQTLGEMTLEDFLVKAGVVQESSSLFKSSLLPQNQTVNIAGNGPMNASYRFRPAMRLGSSSQHDIGNNVSSNVLETHRMLPQNISTSGAVEKCQSLPESSGKGNRKRIIDGPPEVVVERRQRRMLKNRESAARSRARRQAYTVELEAELNVLKQENEKLKQILAEAERKRKQEICQRKHTTMAQKRTEKMRAMKRPVSAAW